MPYHDPRLRGGGFYCTHSTLELLILGEITSTLKAVKIYDDFG